MPKRPAPLLLSATIHLAEKARLTSAIECRPRGEGQLPGVPTETILAILAPPRHNLVAFAENSLDLDESNEKATAKLGVPAKSAI
ncbi:hypothetical protein BDR05DRAFT_1005005 [Suillus weaverae]|nr:hypothetical protein BDR05DRAFT_1005005 [Suillus weaverae]